jgi:hypothetical protein
LLLRHDGKEAVDVLRCEEMFVRRVNDRLGAFFRKTVLFVNPSFFASLMLDRILP